MKKIGAFGKPVQTQKFRLATLFDFYEANPQQEYILSVQNNNIRTTISSQESKQNRQMDFNCYEQSMNLSVVDQMARKTAGLFSNLLKQIKSSKDDSKKKDAPQKKQYQFYYKCFQQQREASPFRKSSTKKVKQRALGVEDNNFEHIDLNILQPKENNQPKTFYNQSKIYKNNIDFSFDEIKADEKNQKYQIKIGAIDQKKSSESLVEIPKEDKNILSLPKPLIPMAISKDNSNKTQNLLIPYKQRIQTLPTKVNKLNQFNKEGKSLSKEDFQVEGARKIESRIYEQVLKGSSDPKQIEIDFDLDLNFV